MIRISKRRFALAATSVLAGAFVLASCASDQAASSSAAPAASVAAAAPAAPAAAPAPAPQPAQSSYAEKLAAMKLDIPYTKYTLKNGLTLLVNEDHKTPTVYFNIWYHVASKNEPRGRSGFAHLFEHIMYNGSEHFNDDFFKATQKFGATNQNGSTSQDRTNYFQTVPKEALDSILWLESDRMGYLLPALDQHRLDEQRGVVQNEKRQGDNQPYGLVQYHVTAATYPEEHPYGHTVIGSMDDLNAAKLEDVKDWFRTWYGPSNAVVVLSGDIKPEEARAKVEKYFGEIPSGPPPSHPKAWVAKRTGHQREEMYDRVASPRIYKVWNVPEFDNPDGELLDAAASALAGDKNARLTKRLVYDEQVATNVSAFNGQSELAGQFRVTVTAKPEANLAHIEQVIDEEMNKLFQTGPTEGELEKLKVSAITDIVGQVERTSSKGQLLATWETYTGNGGGWKESLKRTEAATAPAVATAARKWLSDGDYTLTVKPFGDFKTGPGVDRSKLPTPGSVAEAKFPEFKKATLSNGMKVYLAERHDTPTVSLMLSMDTGYPADYARLKPGVQGLTGNLLDEGTTTRTGLQIADQLDRMGASVVSSGGPLYSTVSMSALAPTLDDTMAIWADVVRNPAFTDADFKRVQAQTVQGLRQQQRDPTSIAGRVMTHALYGADHPYGHDATPETVASVTRQDVLDFYKTWYGPTNARIVIVGDTTMDAITPKLEAALKGWAPVSAKTVAIPQAARPAKPVVYLVDRPGSVQSVILVGEATAPRVVAEDQKMSAFNSLFGGAFTSRINMNLREQHGWSYGARTSMSRSHNPGQFLVQAPVQTDATKGALNEIRKELTEVVGKRPPTSKELEENAKATAIMGLASRWEAGASVQGALYDMALENLPDDYWNTYAAKYRAVTTEDMAATAKKVIPDQNFVWVVVGDRAKIEKGIRELNIGELRIVDANGAPAN